MAQAHGFRLFAVAVLLLAGLSAGPTALAGSQASPETKMVADASASQSTRASTSRGIDDRTTSEQASICAQHCDGQAEQMLQTCLRTVATLKSDPTWMDDTLSANSCARAAVSGANLCQKRCGEHEDGRSARVETTRAPVTGSRN